MSEDLRPDCFGYIVTYNKGSNICKVCTFSDRCKSKVQERINRLQKIMKDTDVEAIAYEKDADGKNLNLKEIEVSDTVSNKKASNYLENIEAKYEMDWNSIALGVKPPFVGEYDWLSIAIVELQKGTCTKLEIRNKLMESLGWSRAAAATHVSMIIAILDSVGILQSYEEGYIGLRTI